jgi:release factor glutamine methyltransferase
LTKVTTNPGRPSSDFEGFARVDLSLARARKRLSAASETAGLDAQVLLAEVLGQSRAWLMAHPDYDITPQQHVDFDGDLERVSSGTPLPYVLGHWEFYGLDFQVSPAVLIPRPETELLVETALEWLRDHPGRRDAVEAGTGSGCISIALAVHCADLTAWAGDISRPALEVARCNRDTLVPGKRLHLFQADLLSCVAGPFDLIVANLPYIPTASLIELSIYGHEPSLALDGGADGLDVIRRWLADASRLLAPRGLLLAEIEAGQGHAASAAAAALLPGRQVSVLKDYSGRDRLLRVEG